LSCGPGVIRRSVLGLVRPNVDHHASRAARAAGRWQPVPRMRPEPPTAAPVVPIATPDVVPPALADYAELCA
jgi:hypothetical protein